MTWWRYFFFVMVLEIVRVLNCRILSRRVAGTQVGRNITQSFSVIVAWMLW